MCIAGMFSATACVVKLIGRGQCIGESGLTEVMDFIWICKSEKGGGVYMNWWILEKYFNTFDMGIVNELIHDKN